MRKFTTVLMAFLLSAVTLFAQNKTITGKVTDEKGAGIQGASVKAVGSSKGAITSADGGFTLSVPSNAKQLEISGVGLETQRIAIPTNGPAIVKMKATTAVVAEEVIVNTGIQSYKAKHYAGTANRMTEKEIANQPVGSLDQILQGRTPGLLALTGSGAPGTSANVIIRGSASVLGGSSPLYIVDGIQVEEGVFQGINPNDFSSMEVLRDAAGTALYGSRGSAGVIVVTTKRGKAGKVSFNYSAQYGYKDKPAFTYEMMNSSQLLKAQEDYGNFLQIDNTNPGINVLGNMPGWYYSSLNPANIGLTPAELAANKAILDSMGSINTNWRDVFFRRGTFSNHQLDIQGGIGKARFRSSIGLYNEEGITLRTDMKRISWRNNFDYSDDKFTVQLNTALAFTKRSFQQSTTTNSLGNPFLVANVVAPYTKVYDANGKVNVGPTSQTQLNVANGLGYNFTEFSNKYSAANTLDLTNRDLSYNDQVKITANIIVSYKLTKNLTANVNTGIDFRETQNSAYSSRLAFTRVTSTNPRTNSGAQTEGLGRFFAPNTKLSLNWNKIFKDKHEFDFTVLGEHYSEYEKSFTMTGYGIDPKTPNTPAAITAGNVTNQLIPLASGGKTRNSLLGGVLLGRYTFDDRITLTATYRTDGASKLPIETRWQDFFSVGGNWNLTKEKFLANNKTFNSLRLRVSYGSAGNFNNFPFGNFSYIPSWSTAGNYNGSSAYGISSIGNSELRWEKIYTINLGVDFEMFKNRLYGDINVYDRRTKDMFIPTPLSAASAAWIGSEITRNQGSLLNKGVEVNLNYQLIRSRNATLTLYTNFAYNRNEILDLGPGVTSFEQGTELVTVGKPLGSHYEVKWGGVDAATGRPLYYDIDGKLTTTYSANNRVQDYGTWEAPFKGGFGTRLSYKNWDFNVLFTFQSGSYKVNNLEYFVENHVGFLQNGYNQANTLKMWLKPGDVASTPSPLYGTNFSSKIIHDASFIRLREVSASYRLPQSAIDKIKFIKGARFFILANNLYLWTKWIGLDPEAGATNINLSEFPNPKTTTVGLDINF